MKAGAFPRRVTWSNWGGLMRDARLFAPLARIACARHGFPFHGIAPGFPGTCAAFAVGSRGGSRPFFVKFFPPMVRGDFARELLVLKLLGRMKMPWAPGLLGHGLVEVGAGWPYLLMEAVEGRALRNAWPLVPDKDRSRIARQAGEWLSMFNRIRVSKREADAAGFRPWKEFLLERKGRVSAELRRAGFTSPSFLGEAKDRVSGLRDFGPIVLVNGDLTEDHVMVSRGRRGWGISGIIDFADALSADPRYELAPVWLGTFGRDPGLMRAFLGAFMPGCAVTPAWRDRAAAFTVIHRFGPAMISALLKRDGLNPRKFKGWAEFRDWLWPRVLDQRGRKRK